MKDKQLREEVKQLKDEILELRSKFRHLEWKVEEAEHDMTRYTRVFVSGSSGTYIRVDFAIEKILDHLDVKLVHSPESVTLKSKENDT